MTKTEASALAAGLSRVWQPLEPLKLTRDIEGSFGFSTAQWRPGVEFSTFYCQRAERFGYTFQIERRNENGCWTGRIWCHIETGIVNAEVAPMHAHKRDLQTFYAEFSAQWLDVFRCGCYLSGAPIECCAHERAEWLLWLHEERGVSAEEIEGWGL